jgi:RNA polymerase-binding transcription factor DksA
MTMQQKQREGTAVGAFTLDDVREVIRTRSDGEVEPNIPSAETVAGKSPRKKTRENSTTQKARKRQAAAGTAKRSAASIMDILGFDPNALKNSAKKERGAVPEKWKKHFDALLSMREELQVRFSRHREETLKQNDSEATDRPNMLGQHTVDGAAEQADLERAMSFVENEQELLREVEDALDRIHRGTYGFCEQTGESIDAVRLDALPFARFSLRGREEYERTKRDNKKTEERVLFSSDEGDIAPADDEDGDGAE